MDLEVIGLPAPKGSKNAFVHKSTGRAVIVEASSKSLRAWQNAIANALAGELEQRPRPPISGPVAVTLRFRFAPVKSDPYRCWHDTKPDIDKLTRAVLDALSGVAITDDARVAKMTLSKRYVNDSETPGCSITIESLEAEEAELRESRKQRAAMARRPQTNPLQDALL